MNQKIAMIPISRDNLFYRWLELCKPFHNIPKQHMTVLAWLLFYFDKYRYETNNDDIAWTLTFHKDTKTQIRDKMGIKDQTLQNAFTYLRKRNIIVNNKIKDEYIPDLEKDAKEFKLILNFIINE